MLYFICVSNILYCVFVVIFDVPNNLFSKNVYMCSYQVFFPILVDGHWSAVITDLKKEKNYILDSSITKPENLRIQFICNLVSYNSKILLFIYFCFLFYSNLFHNIQSVFCRCLHCCPLYVPKVCCQDFQSLIILIIYLLMFLNKKTGMYFVFSINFCFYL